MSPTALFLRQLKAMLRLSFIAALSVTVSSCAANHSASQGRDAAPVGGAELKQIQSIAVSEEDQRTILTINGSSDLLFSDIRKSSPPTVSFYFPGTELVDIQDTYAVNTPPHPCDSDVGSGGRRAYGQSYD